MKKLLITLLSLTLLFSALVAQDFKYTFIMPKINPARDLGMGSSYITDTSTYFSFLSNPASLGLTGDKTLLPIINTRIAGPLDSIPAVITEFKKANDDDPTTEADYLGLLIDHLGKAKGLNIAFESAGPLCFGAIRKNFGWGLFNQTYTFLNVPSLLYANAYGGNESLLRFGYGYPITLPIPLTFSLGLSAEAVSKVEGLYTVNALKLASSFMGGGNIDLTSLTIPLYTSFGYGLDAGLTIRAFDIVSLSFVWDDFFYGIYTQKSNSTLAIIDGLIGGEDFISLFDNNQKNTSIGSSKKMALGLGVNIPLATITNNFISSWLVMVDCNDLVSVIESDPKKRNPILEFSAGTEIVFFKTIIIRFGVDEMYPSAGMGLRLGVFTLDASLYGQELGFEPGSRPQINTAISIGFYY